MYFLNRASIEPNFHDLYLKFLDKLNSKTLNKEILKSTYENCKVIVLKLSSLFYVILYQLHSYFLYVFRCYWGLTLSSRVQKSAHCLRILVAGLENSPLAGIKF